jgi:hypothetical protein
MKLRKLLIEVQEFREGLALPQPGEKMYFIGIMLHPVDYESICKQIDKSKVKIDFLISTSEDAELGEAVFVTSPWSLSGRLRKPATLRGLHHNN